jgi:hypothetical protein
MDVLLRQYVKTAEENDILYTEVITLREMMLALLQENADLRFQLGEAGVEVVPSPLGVHPEDFK